MKIFVQKNQRETKTNIGGILEGTSSALIMELQFLGERGIWTAIVQAVDTAFESEQPPSITDHQNSTSH